MSGLRESKKAATRIALSRAAAKIALDSGPEALTVSAIAAAADVSTRTFHNYFSSREEALVEFISDQIEALLQKLQEASEELDILSAIEFLVVEHLKSGDSDIESFGALFRLSEILIMMSPNNSVPDKSLVLISLRPSVQLNFPELDEFEASVAVEVIAAAICIALEWYYQLPEPRDPNVGAKFVHRACSMVGAWTFPHLSP